VLKRLIYLFLLITLLVSTGILAYLLTARAATFPQAQATLKMTSGTTLITPDSVLVVSGSKTISASPNATVQVGEGARLKVDGIGTLSFVGTQIDLIPGVELLIKTYHSQGKDAQIEITLTSGQLVQHVDGYPDARSYYKLNLPHGQFVTHGGDFFAHISSADNAQVASISGVGDVIIRGRVRRINAGEGSIVNESDPPLAPAAWSRVLIPTYRPDGTEITLPLTLTDERNNDQFHAVSNQYLLLPPATYTLELKTLTTYRVPSLTLVRDQFNEIPITLGEIVFTTTTNGQITPYKALQVKSDQDARVVPDEPLLVAPTTNPLIVASEDNPEKVQPVKVDVGPGQRYALPLRNDLFGGGFIKVDLGSPDGTVVAPVSVLVFNVGSEDGDPVATFKSDETSPLLPSGDYIVSVRTQLAGRYPLTVVPNQSMTLSVPLGYINVDYTDPNGKAVNRTAFVYLASSAEMQRLGLSPDQMRRTPYGLGAAINAADKLLVPAGTYTIEIDDRIDVTKENIQVEAGHTVIVRLEVAPQ
jgi:hypothetical protein